MTEPEPEGTFPGWGDEIGDWNFDDYAEWEYWGDFDEWPDEPNEPEVKQYWSLWVVRDEGWR